MRCSAMQPLPSGMYRCIHEHRDGHTEHYFNYYRALTPEERVKYDLPDPYKTDREAFTLPPGDYDYHEVPNPRPSSDPLGPRSAERHDRVYLFPHTNERKWLDTFYQRYESSVRHDGHEDRHTHPYEG